MMRGYPTTSSQGSKATKTIPQSSFNKEGSEIAPHHASLIPAFRLASGAHNNKSQDIGGLLDSPIREACGLFGIYGNKNASKLTYFGIYSLQHRGQESAGIVVSDEHNFTNHKGMGLVSEIFTHERINALKGHIAIGHVRYSTTGSSTIVNAQPFLAKCSGEYIAIAHNGNLVNTCQLHKELESKGAIFQSSMDSEIIVHLIAMSKEKKFEQKLIEAIKKIKGAYSLLLLTKDKLIAVRDPLGFRPLCLGKHNSSYVVASETCALDIINAKYIREIEPGEILIIDKDGLKSITPFKNTKKHAFCIFEYIYFARPDSNIFGKNVYITRKRLGRQLAKEWPVDADIVLAIPDSGNYAALGYAEEMKIFFEMGIVRNHYIGRTFIQPFQEIRDLNVRIKLNPIKEVVRNKKIVVVEDSIVRGTTSRIRMKTLYNAGAKEIHMRISCPPLRYPCFYGIDFPTRQELVAASHSVEEIRKSIGVNSLGYLSLEGLLEAMLLPKEEFCTACFNGKYPISPKETVSKYSLEAYD